MVFDLDLIKKVYAEMPAKIAAAKKITGKALTLLKKSCTHICFPKPYGTMRGEKIMWILHRTAWPCRMQRPKWPCCNS